jgi:hypothetical protein
LKSASILQFPFGIVDLESPTVNRTVRI